VKLDLRIVVVAATPLASLVVGLAARPEPRNTASEERAVDRTTLGDVVSRQPPTPQKMVAVTLGDRVQLRGADLPTAALSRGERLAATLHWQALAAIEEDWQIFVHIDADDGGFRMHADHYPAHGRYRTSAWQKGEFIADAFDVVVPTAAPAGLYTVWVGLYRGETRLPFSAGDPGKTDGSHRIKAGVIVVE
jgi:hypothetical protein